MIKELIFTFLIGHFLGDYYFQTDASVENQTRATIVQHGLIYTIVQLLVILPFFNWAVFIAALIISVTHFVIDYVKFVYKERHKITYERSVIIYIIDQIVHLGIIFISGVLLKLNHFSIEYHSNLQEMLLELQINTEWMLSWILILLIIYKPASITIRIVLDHFEPHHKQKEDFGIPNAGALIGIFERLFILMMLYVGQYTAIGFVLTAKSVARYNKISEDPQFAEYYLLGTLLSSLIIIISFYLIF